MRTPDVFLHIGLPKTGTTTLQAELEGAAEELERHGVLFAGRRHRNQRLATYDLLGQRIEGDDPKAAAGAWHRLLAEIDAFDGRSVVVSEEALSLARPRHARRLVRDLSGHRVFVVVSVRDLARTLVSAWQQSVVMGGECPWPDYIASVRDPTHGSAGLSFWVRHDLPRVLDIWGSAVPPERIRIVTVPPPRAGAETLLDRFAAAAELPPSVLCGSPKPRNVSFSAAEVEILRRLNGKIVEPLSMSVYRHVVEQGIRARLVSDRSHLLQLPEEHVDWARTRGEELVAHLKDRNHPVYGDLQDLVPAEPVSGVLPPHEASDRELLAASEAELASLALAYGALVKRYRQSFRKEEGRLPTPAELFGSSARAAVFSLQKRGLAAADNPLVNWAGRVYLKRTAGRPRSG